MLWVCAIPAAWPVPFLLPADAELLPSRGWVPDLRFSANNQGPENNLKSIKLGSLLSYWCPASSSSNYANNDLYVSHSELCPTVAVQAQPSLLLNSRGILILRPKGFSYIWFTLSLSRWGSKEWATPVDIGILCFCAAYPLSHSTPKTSFQGRMAFAFVPFFR